MRSSMFVPRLSDVSPEIRPASGPSRADTEGGGATNAVKRFAQRDDALTPAATPRGEFGTGSYVEVDEALYQARLAVADPFTRASAGYDARPCKGEPPQIAYHRQVAARLDRKIKACREAERDDVQQDAGEGILDEDIEDLQAVENETPESDDGEAHQPGEQVLGSPDPSFADDVFECERTPATPVVVVRQPGASRNEADDIIDACLAVDDEFLAVVGLGEDADDEIIDTALSALHGVDDAEGAAAYRALVQSALEALKVAAQHEAECLATQAAVKTSLPGFLQASVFDSPWVKARIPAGFDLKADGVVKIPDDDKPPVRLTMAPVYVDGLVRSGISSGWAVRVRALNREKKVVEVFVSNADLQGGKTAVASEFANLGVVVLKPVEFSQYLMLAQASTELPYLLGVDSMGFTQAPADDGGTTLCFVLPGVTLYADGVTMAEDVVLLPRAQAAIHRAYQCRGSLAEWQALVAQTRGNALQTVGLALAFAAPLLPFGNVEDGGVHIYGHTSRGKTIVLQLAATVFGNGAARVDGVADPVPTLVRSWHGTQNAVEAMTAEVSGTLAIFDEIGVHRGPVSPYSQTGGQGKGRANSAGRLQEGQSWRSLILSSGEVPTSHHVESQGGKPMMGGEAARLVNVPGDDLLVEGDAQAMELLKRACGRIYGTAGPAFVRWVLNRFEGDAATLTETLTDAVDSMRDGLCDEAVQAGYKLQSPHLRAMRRLALAAVAGQWAVEAGVLPHTADEVLDAVRCVRDAWLGAQVFESQADRAVTKVRDYVSRFRGGMADTAASRGRPMLPSNCRGILHDGHVLLTKSNFEDACGGFDVESVARALKDAGILHTNEPRHFTVKTSIAALGIASARYYKLSFERLYGDAGGVQSDEEVTADADVGSAM